MKKILTFITAMFIAAIISGCATSQGNMKHHDMKSCTCDMKKQEMKACKCKSDKMSDCKDGSCSISKKDMTKTKPAMSCGAGKCGK